MLRDVSVLAVGDVMLDEYVWGEVRRISPEAPVPVVEIHRRSHAAGGVAYVAVGVVALAGRAFVAGVVGNDAAALALRDTLETARVDTSALVTDARRPTTCKTRVIAHAQQVVRTDHEDRAPLREEIETALLAQVHELVARADVVVLSDYRKGVVTLRVAREVIDAAAAAGKPVVVDPKGIDYTKYRGATVVKPSLHDAGLAANVHIESEPDLLKAVGRLSEACDGAALLLTRGSAGMSLFTGNGRVDVPTVARAVYDVTGAGDTVSAALAVALGSGVPLPRAVALANAAAGVVVGKVGTSTVTVDELDEFLRTTE